MRALLWATLAAIALSIACEGQPMLSRMGEPIQVVGGQFIEGDLPGTPPPAISSEAGSIPVAGPIVTDISLSTGVLVLTGEAGKSLSGRAKGATAVGVRFADMGTGYWIVPVAESEPQFPGENNFRISANFDANDPGGLHPLRFVGVDASGHAGAQSEISMCLTSRIPDNLHACLPNTPPPAAVITLQWDTNFDVDLHVVTPDGVDVNPKAPLAEPVEAGTSPAPRAARIDRDSLGACIVDGLRQEDLIFQNPPSPGLYKIYADPYSACGQSAVRFKLTIYQSGGVCPSCALQQKFTQRGELLATQVTGGGSTGLAVYSFSF